MREQNTTVTAMEWWILIAASAALVVPALVGWMPLSKVEVMGFVTGGVCVWLVVRQNMANWPVGLANNIAFLVLFWKARLFADAALQIVYFGFGIWGWWNWLYGGKDRGRLRVARAGRLEMLMLLFLLPLLTWGLRDVLVRVNGAAPWGDALTTILSLQAQYLLCRKRLENWFFWIAADLVYIPLYIMRGLPLTALLYTVFLGLCLAGLRQWRKSLKEGSA